MKNSFLSKISKVLSGNIAAQGLQFIAITFVARNYSPDEFAYISILLAFYTLSFQFIDLGISASYIKYCSFNELNSENTSDLFYTITLFRVLVYFAYCILFYFISDHVSEFIFNDTRMSEMLMIITLMLVINTLFLHIQSYLQLNNRFSSYSFLLVSVSVIKVSIVLSMIYADFNYKLLIFAFIVPYSISIFVLVKVMDIKSKFEPAYIKGIMKYGFKIFLVGILSNSWVRLELFLLQKYGVTSDVAYYNAAFVLVSVIPIISYSMFTVILPNAKHYLDNNTDLLKIKFEYIVMLMILMMLSILVAPFAIEIIYGHEYSRSVLVMQILLPTSILSLVFMPLISVIYMRHLEFRLLQILLLSIFIDIVSNAILIPEYGIVGASISASISKLAYYFLMFKIIRNSYKRSPEVS